MAEDVIAQIAGDPRYQTLVGRRTRFTWALTGVMLAAFFGFILLIAFDKPFLAHPIGSGVMSRGIVIGFSLILLAIALTGLYVRRANQEYDALVDGLAVDYRA